VYIGGVFPAFLDSPISNDELEARHPHPNPLPSRAREKRCIEAFPFSPASCLKSLIRHPDAFALKHLDS